MRTKSFSWYLLFIYFGLFIFSDLISALLLLLKLPKITTPLCVMMSVVMVAYICFFYEPKFKIEYIFPILLLLLDFVLLSFNMVRTDQFKNIPIIFFRQVFYPFTFFLIGMTFETEKLQEIIYNRFFMFIILGFAIVEIILFNLFKDYFTVLLNLFKEESITIFSFQTSLKGIRLRISSVFGSALIFAIYMNGCFLYHKDKKIKIFSVVLLLLSFNRVGYLAFIVSIILQYCSIKNFKNYIFFLTILLSFVAIGIGFYSNSFAYNITDNSFIFKLSTFISRLNGWRILQELKDYELFIGMGYLQGFGNKYTFVADNLFIYKILQTGFLGLILLYLIIGFFVIKIPNKPTDSEILFLSYLPFFMLNLLLFDLIYLVVVFSPLYSTLKNSMQSPLSRQKI